jgi:hypothetical protein
MNLTRHGKDSPNRLGRCWIRKPRMTSSDSKTMYALRGTPWPQQASITPGSVPMQASGRSGPTVALQTAHFRIPGWACLTDYLLPFRQPFPHSQLDPASEQGDCDCEGRQHPHLEPPPCNDPSNQRPDQDADEQIDDESGRIESLSSHGRSFRTFSRIVSESRSAGQDRGVTFTFSSGHMMLSRWALAWKRPASCLA